MRPLLVVGLSAIFLAACGSDAPSPAPAPVSAPPAPAPAAEVTWYRDVQPLMAQNCQGCHVAGGIAPFALETYAQAQPMAAAIADAVSAGRMPPWHADESCRPLKDSRKMNDADVAKISAWAAQGAPQGDIATAPPNTGPRPLPQLAWVDRTLAPAQPYTPAGTRADEYVCFALDPQLAATQYIVGTEVVPGVREMVHHVLLFAVSRASAAASLQGGLCQGGSTMGAEQRLFGAWVPGTGATIYPADTGVALTADEVVLMQVHYNLAATAPRPDATQVKLQFARTPVAKPARILSLAARQFSIPPGGAGYSTSYTVTPGATVGTVWGVMPHMHQLGRKIKIDSSAGCMADVPRWDFRWQQTYFFQQPLTIAAGTQASISCTWDNPSTQPVIWGSGTSDEMCLGYLYVTQ
jgi:hypothetical protein